jgi:hypothetical protein
MKTRPKKSGLNLCQNEEERFEIEIARAYTNFELTESEDQSDDSATGNAADSGDK